MSPVIGSCDLHMSISVCFFREVVNVFGRFMRERPRRHALHRVRSCREHAGGTCTLQLSSTMWRSSFCCCCFLLLQNRFEVYVFRLVLCINTAPMIYTRKIQHSVVLSTALLIAFIDCLLLIHVRTKPRPQQYIQHGQCRTRYEGM